MQKPKSIGLCEKVIYCCIAATALVSLIEKRIGVIGVGEFTFQLIVNGLFCVVPYKLGRGSNPARYVYLISALIGVLLMLGGGVTISRLGLILAVVLIPVQIYVSWALFQPEAAQWFTGEVHRGTKTPRYENSERQDPK